MKLTRFLEHLDRVIPLSLAMEDDPVGLHVMAEDRDLTKVGIAYELNGEVIRKLADSGVELIIAFHPLIYPHLRSITGKNRVEQSVIDLIDSRIALYILHTAFDAHPRGTSTLLAEALGCEDIHPLVPSPLIEGGGMGAVGRLSSPLPLTQLAERLREVCKTAVVRISAPPEGSVEEKEISTVAILGGSGMSFYSAACSSGAEAFITADTRYHAFHAANDSIPILDPGHAESEVFVVEGMTRVVEQCIRDMELEKEIEVIPLHDSTNPIRYIV